MNLLCSSNQENEFIEAMNTLENEKIKQNQKNNSPNNLISLTTRDPSLTGINELKHNLKKTSSILEIIDYPFGQNSRKISEMHFKGESSLTDKNGETELMVEYMNKYKNQSNNVFKKYKKGNKAFLNKNIIVNQNFKIINKYNNDTKSNIFKDIIYNSSNNYINNKIISEDNISFLTSQKFTNELDINSNNNDNNNICLVSYKSTLKDSSISNKYKNVKNYKTYNYSKNDSLNNSKYYCKESKNSIPFNKKSYSNDTILSRENNSKKNYESINYTTINNQEKIKKQKSKIKNKIKKIPTCKYNKKKNKGKEKEKEKEFNYNNNTIIKNIEINNKDNILKNINKSDKKLNNSKIKKNNVLNINDKLIKTIKAMKLDIDKKILNLTKINKNEICKKKNKDKTEKINLKIKYLIGKININCIHKDYYCPTKEGLNGESFHKLHLLTQNKTIINNNIKKIIPKKSNSEKIKNLKVEKKINIVSKNITNNKNKSHPYLLIKNQIYNCKKLIKKPLMKNNEKERYSNDCLFKKIYNFKGNKKLSICDRNLNNKINNNSNKRDLKIIKKRSIMTLEKKNISLYNINHKYYHKINKKSLYNSRINIKSNKINNNKTFIKCNSFKSTKNKTICIFDNKTFNKERSLKLQKILSN